MEFPQKIVSKRGITYVHQYHETDEGLGYEGYFSYKTWKRYPKLCVLVRDGYGEVSGWANKIENTLIGLGFMKK